MTAYLLDMGLYEPGIDINSYLSSTILRQPFCKDFVVDVNYLYLEYVSQSLLVVALLSNLRPDDILRGSLLEMLQLARSPWGVLPILASPLGSHHPEHGIHIPVASSYKNKNKRKNINNKQELANPSLSSAEPPPRT